MITLEQKNQWVASLRSGEYKQGKECLHDPNTSTYCCLGVLEKVCEIRRTSSIFLDYNSFPESYQHSLSAMNDSGYNFHEIADWIELNVRV